MENFFNGVRDGTGKEYYSNGKLYFDGKYSKGNKWEGAVYNKNGIMECRVKNGVRVIKNPKK